MPQTLIIGSGYAQLFQLCAHLRGCQFTRRIRKYGQTAEQLFPPDDSQHTIFAKHQHDAVRFDALRLFLGLDRKLRNDALRIAFAACANRTEQAGGAFRRTHHRAHLHHGVGKRAGAVWRNKRLRLLLYALAGGRRAHFIPNGKIPADHALDIAIHGGNRNAEGDCRNRSARIIPDAGKRTQLLRIGGQHPAMPG